MLVQAISPFPTMFSKGFPPRPSKGVIVWEWVRMVTFNYCVLFLSDKIFIISRAKMDELRMFLENEGWELCPVKSSFHVLNLVVS